MVQSVISFITPKCLFEKGEIMKKVIAYVNTLRVHWLIGELGSVGIKEIKVVEYFKPLSQVSRIDLLCDEEVVDRACRVIHDVGTSGGLPDHLVFVNDFEPKPMDTASLGKKMGKLDD